jgi:hypothetical protein
MNVWPNHAVQRTRLERRDCNRGFPCAGSLSLGSALAVPRMDRVLTWQNYTTKG